MIDIQSFHKAFYSKSDKIYQDNFILKHCHPANVQRRRPKDNSRNRLVKITYNVRSKDGRLVPVCQSAFINILGVSVFRVLRIAKRYHQEGDMPKENRGGDHKSNKYQEAHDCIMNFLNKLKCVEAHYCRSQISSRKYLPSDLNIRKLWRMYTSQEMFVPAKESYFRKIFCSEYNLGFGTPRTDVCSTYLMLGEKIKREKDERRKYTLLAERRIHKLRANAFYELLKDDAPETLILSFDCQKNQNLPKLPDQTAYYSRQMYIYNFTVVRGHSKGKINPETVRSYCWTENEFSKGSNEIASCVYDTLNHVNLEHIENIRLVCDGCGGQNKNSTMIGMCAKWLSNAPKGIQQVEITFPVTGHSFLPSDRVFGLIEKELKKIEQILEPQEYIDVFEKYGTVIKLGTDCIVADWKKSKRRNFQTTSIVAFSNQILQKSFSDQVFQRSLYCLSQRRRHVQTLFEYTKGFVQKI